MSQRRAEQPDFETLAMRYLDGQADAEQVRVLEAMLLGEPERHRAFVELSYQHGLMCELLHSDESDVADGAPIDTAWAPVARGTRDPLPFRRRFFQPARVAAMLLGAALLGILFFFATRLADIDRGNRAPVVATLVQADHAVWEKTGQTLRAGAELERGQLELISGKATLRFISGAEVDIVAPARLQLQGPNRGFLHNGKILATVPQRAHGFTVSTPVLHAVDHGTVFGVDVNPNGPVEVHVFEGAVEATVAEVEPTPQNPEPELPNSKPIRLTTQEAVRVAAPDQQAQKIQAKAQSFDGFHKRWRSGFDDLQLAINRAGRTTYVDLDGPAVRKLSVTQYNVAPPQERVAFGNRPYVPDAEPNRFWLVAEDIVDAHAQPTGDDDFEDILVEVQIDPGDGFSTVTMWLRRGYTKYRSFLVDRTTKRDLLGRVIPSRTQSPAIYRFKILNPTPPGQPNPSPAGPGQLNPPQGG